MPHHEQAKTLGGGSLSEKHGSMHRSPMDVRIGSAVLCSHSLLYAGMVHHHRHTTIRRRYQWELNMDAIHTGRLTHKAAVLYHGSDVDLRDRSLR